MPKDWTAGLSRRRFLGAAAVSAGGLWLVAEADVIEGVRGLTLTNTRINGQLRDETISR